MQTASVPPVDEKAAALAEADRLLRAEEHRHVASLAGSRELKWLAGICLMLLLPIFGAPYVMPSHHATLVCYYGAIVGFVVAGWGSVRAFWAVRKNDSLYRWIAGIYLLLFLGLAVLYGGCMISPKLDKPWVWIWEKTPPRGGKK